MSEQLQSLIKDIEAYEQNLDKEGERFAAHLKEGQPPPPMDYYEVSDLTLQGYSIRTLLVCHGVDMDYSLLNLKNTTIQYMLHRVCKLDLKDADLLLQLTQYYWHLTKMMIQDNQARSLVKAES